MKGTYRVYAQLQRGDKWTLMATTDLAAEAKLQYRKLTATAWKVRIDLTIHAFERLP